MITKNENKNHSSGGAHIGAASGAGFGRRAPLLAPDDGGGGGGGGGEKMIPQSQVNALIGAARREEREKAGGGGGGVGGQPAYTLDQLKELAGVLGIMMPGAGGPGAGGAAAGGGAAQQQQPPPAAAPHGNYGAHHNPSGIGAANGLTDIFNLSIDQIDALGPEGLRAEHEKIIDRAHRSGGRPRVPGTPKKAR